MSHEDEHRLQLDELIPPFLADSVEAIEQMEQDLIALEKDPEQSELIARIFRSIHMIKGSCGFFGFTTIEGLSHAAENLLLLLRGKTLRVTPAIVDLLMSLGDAYRQVFAHIQKYNREGEHHFGDLLQRFKQQESAPTGEDGLNHKEPQGRRMSAVITPQPPQPHAEVDSELQDLQQDTHLDAGPEESYGAHDLMVKVDTGLLDYLMNRIGELVIARNALMRFASQLGEAAPLTLMRNINLLVTELQEGFMKTRMQPIDTIWRKYPRLIRDLTKACDNRIQLHMDGNNTELDRNLIDAIKDPLLHILRNAAVHGIEKPEDRIAAGKPAEGTIWLRASHEGGQVNIEVSDDGAGIHIEKLKRRAVSLGLLSEESAARLSETAAQDLIFLRGLSLSEQSTHLSGRGVGMDIVKSNVDKVGGSVEVKSILGKGTSFRLKLPLTLMIIPALIIQNGGSHFAIPQANLLELIHLEGEQIHTQIERALDATVLHLRNQLLPLIELNTLLGLPAPASRDEVNIVAIQANDRSLGLIVDRIVDTEEIVVKPLGMLLKKITTYAGATIMGNGDVALILDAAGLMRRLSLSASLERRLFVEQDAAKVEAAVASQQELLLVISTGVSKQVIPASHVSRLEEIPLASVERVGSIHVVQYRGQILPLISLIPGQGLAARLRALHDHEGANHGDAEHFLSVVVCQHGGSSVGLVVQQILDIVPSSGAPQRGLQRPGVVGFIVINGQVMEYLDCDALIQHELNRIDQSHNREAMS
jgi:two-component system chemotaxis sensor kinase CheA